MKSTLLFGTGSLLLLLAAIVAAPGDVRSNARADDAAPRAESADPLVVRDVSVFLLSAYGTKLNDRDLFASSLPGYTLSRRPTAPRDKANEPVPMGIMTFSGPGESDVDVLLEFEQGRVLTHWPPGALRSKRLLWSGIDVAPHVEVDPAALPEGHWLSPLRQSGRLMVKGNRSADHFLLYDAELPFAPHLTLTRDESGGYTVTNTGAFAVRDVVVYRPASDGMWEVAAVPEVAAAPKAEAPAQAEAAATAPAGSPAPGQPQPTATPAAAPAAVNPAPAAAAPAVAQPGQAPSTADAQPAGAPSQARPAPGTTASAPAAGTLNAEQALQSWHTSLADLQLESPEIEFVLGILRQQALRRDSAMLVYRLDEAHLEQLLPLEVTPYPDRLFRVGLVIVQDADPDLQSRVDALVAQLGDDQWQQREAAQEQLAELGLAAKPKLEAALQNQDAEIVFRAEQLLEALQTQPVP